MLDNHTFKLVSDDGEKLMYQGGYWCYKRDIEKYLSYPGKYSWDVSKISKQGRLLDLELIRGVKYIS